jgi:hypothetical protein
MRPIVKAKAEMRETDSSGHSLVDDKLKHETEADVCAHM